MSLIFYQFIFLSLIYLFTLIHHSYSLFSLCLIQLLTPFLFLSHIRLFTLFLSLAYSPSYFSLLYSSIDAPFLSAIHSLSLFLPPFVSIYHSFIHSCLLSTPFFSVANRKRHYILYPLLPQLYFLDEFALPYPSFFCR